MEGGFWVLVLIFFVVGPLIERALKGQRPPPPGQAPRPPQRRTLPGAPEETPVGQPQTATDMIPADLWELLTGQKRAPLEAPPAEAPPPLPGTATREPSWRQPQRPDAGTAPGAGTASREPSWRQPPRPDTGTPSSASPASREPSWRQPKKPKPTLRPAPPARGESTVGESDAYAMVLRRDRATELSHAPPTIVSLETEPLSEERRHAAFHDRLEQLAPAARVRRPTGPIELHLSGRSELRRAVILLEILGPPKGLE